MIGQRIGNYVVSEQLGEGGMGAVYLAQHPQIGKRVALKVLHPDLAAREDVVARFFQEAKAVNDIGHPNIVDILDFGTQQTERGSTVYLVMELLAGTTLKHVIKQGPLEPARALRIVQQIGDALTASHARGIVHRDLKPENVMLINRGRDKDFVKLLDFGIAKLTQGGTSKTRTGMVIGTPIYMSPEQCEGRADLDHRTDIYALGIVLFEVLTGRVPFDGDTYTALLVKQLTEPAPSLLKFRPTISRYMDSVVLKALEKRPEDRFATIQDMLAALANPQALEQSLSGVAHTLAWAPTPSPSPSPALSLPPRDTSPVGVATTLSRSAGEVNVATLATQRSKRIPAVAVIAGLVVVAGIISVVAMTGGKSDAKARTPAAPVASTPEAQPAAPEVKPTAPEVKPTAPEVKPAAADVTIAIASTPPGAAVHFRDETAPRCKTPCSIVVAADAPAPAITLKLAGFADVTRPFDPRGETALTIPLVKKRASSTRTTTHQNGHPVGDNTLNPFDN